MMSSNAERGTAACGADTAAATDHAKVRRAHRQMDITEHTVGNVLQFPTKIVKDKLRA